MSVYLPSELWDRIIFCLLSDRHPRAYGYDRRTLVTLDSLCTVNRIVHTAAVNYLYSSIILRAGCQVKLLHRTLVASSYHLSLIRSLYVYLRHSLTPLDYFALHSIMKLLHPTLKRLVYYIPNRQRTSTEEIDDNDVLPFQAIEPFECLEEFCGIIGSRHKEELMVENCARWTTLRRLIIAPSNLQDGCGFADAIRSLPNLTHVAVCVNHWDSRDCSGLRAFLRSEHASLCHATIVSRAQPRFRLSFPSIQQDEGTLLDEAKSARAGLRILCLHPLEGAHWMGTPPMMKWVKDGIFWERGECLRSDAVEIQDLDRSHQLDTLL